MAADKRHDQLRQGICFLIVSSLCILIAGCADPLPPEHKAAIAHMQARGGKILFVEGGYRLNLKKSRITDEDLPELLKIQNLKMLDLQDTRITDEGLKELAKIKTLTYVGLAGTATTREGREALKKARPEVDVRQ